MRLYRGENRERIGKEELTDTLCFSSSLLAAANHAIHGHENPCITYIDVPDRLVKEWLARMSKEWDGVTPPDPGEVEVPAANAAHRKEVR